MTWPPSPFLSPAPSQVQAASAHLQPSDYALNPPVVLASFLNSDFNISGALCLRSTLTSVSIFCAGQKQRSLVHKTKETRQEWKPELGDPTEDGEAFWLPGGALLELSMQVGSMRFQCHWPAACLLCMCA